MVVERCYRQLGRETIHPTQNFISMNLLQMSCVITWTSLFLTSEVVEAVRGQKHHKKSQLFLPMIFLHFFNQANSIAKVLLSKYL